MPDSETIMTNEYPITNDQFEAATMQLGIGNSGFFSHYGLVIRD